MAWIAMQKTDWGEGQTTWEPWACIDTDPPNQPINPMDILHVLEQREGKRFTLVGCGVFRWDKGTLTQVS